MLKILNARFGRQFSTAISTITAVDLKTRDIYIKSVLFNWYTNQKDRLGFGAVYPSIVKSIRLVPYRCELPLRGTGTRVLRTLPAEILYFSKYSLLEAMSSSRRSRSAPRYGDLRPLATLWPWWPFMCHRALHLVRLMTLLKRMMAPCAEVGLIVGQAVRRQRHHGHLGLEIWPTKSSEILSHHQYPESSVGHHCRGCIRRYM